MASMNSSLEKKGSTGRLASRFALGTVVSRATGLIRDVVLSLVLARALFSMHLS